MKANFHLGRAILGGFFLYNGINHFRNLEQMAPYAASKNIPQPKAAVAISGALLTIGGASLLLGVKPKLGSLATITFLAGVSPVMHDFWNDQDPQQKQNNMINFMKNAALAGAAVAIAGAEDIRKEAKERREMKVDDDRAYGRRRRAA